MVRTRSTATGGQEPAPAPAPAPASIPVARAAVHGRGRGRGRGRGHAPIPDRNQAAAPAQDPDIELTPELDDIPEEEIRAAEAQPGVAATPDFQEAVFRVLGYFDSLAQAGMIPVAPDGSQTRVGGYTPDATVAPGFRTSRVLPAAAVAPRIDTTPAPDFALRPMDGPVLTSEERKLFEGFTKMSPPWFYGTPGEDAYEFIVSCHEMLHKLGVVESHRVDYVSFQLVGDAKQWWRSYMECRPIGSPPLTWTQFYQVFLEKYVPRTLRDNMKDEFSTLEQRGRSVAEYETRFLTLSRYATALLPTEAERLEASGASFQSVVEHARKVESEMGRAHSGGGDKKARRFDSFRGSIRGGGHHDRVRHHPYNHPIQSSLQALAGGPSS
ncbi:uncharacterized protein LOC132610647 [Lycium barbarum]|uniref:uncharacterized protein LOC132610647 n=1 Tax=Lycium barbarum TaxID=112863 RepID=UPI00293EF55A|nr:uncharacterized protein LOC132610647 [Lycium barbarum]